MGIDFFPKGFQFSWQKYENFTRLYRIPFWGLFVLNLEDAHKVFVKLPLRKKKNTVFSALNYAVKVSDNGGR